MIKPFTQLYDHNKNPKKSVKGTGYGSKEKALKTLRIIKQEPLIKQKQIVITMYNRAKFHKHRTKKMKHAMKVYEPWMLKNNIHYYVALSVSCIGIALATLIVQRLFFNINL